MSSPLNGSKLLHHVLTFQGRVLDALAQELGDEALSLLLERFDDEAFEYTLEIPEFCLEPVDERTEKFAKEELRAALKRFRFPSDWEFYLWSFPLVRAWDEAEYTLSSEIPSDQFPVVRSLIELSIQQSKAFVRAFRFPSGLEQKLIEQCESIWADNREVLETLLSESIQTVPDVTI